MSKRIRICMTILMLTLTFVACTYTENPIDTEIEPPSTTEEVLISSVESSSQPEGLEERIPADAVNHTEYVAEARRAAAYDQNDLSSWVGEYKYFVPDTRFGILYQLYIIEEPEGFFAYILADGGGAGHRLICSLHGDENEIEMRFAGYQWWFNTIPSYTPGDVLLRFKRVGENIYTEWVDYPKVGEDLDITYEWVEPFPSWIDEAENELLYSLPSPFGDYVAYIYTTHHKELDEFYYLLTVLPEHKEFHFQPANVYATRQPFDIEWKVSDKYYTEGLYVIRFDNDFDPFLDNIKINYWAENMDIAYGY